MSKVKPQIETRERRGFGGIVEMRSKDGATDCQTIKGYAAVFNKESRILGMYDWQFVEVIQPSAFVDADMTDIRCLFNHEASLILGRTKSSTLRTGVDAIGLWYECDLPKTTAGNDVTISIERKDIDGSSFQFEVEDDEWNYAGEIPVRSITKIKVVYDVAPVTFEAYPDTTVAKRSFEGSNVAKPQPSKNLTAIDLDIKLRELQCRV
jgi:uncharacterized protein